MRLISTTDSNLRFTEFTFDDSTHWENVPKYAILSHRWREPGEISLKDLANLHSLPVEKAQGLRKIHALQERAVEERLSYCWIDTCCIDKQSSAELQEAINSMSSWYEMAEVCYAYLDDVDIEYNRETCLDNNENFFARKDGDVSEWFERSWTLQELIAPRRLIFFDCNWKLIGSRRYLASSLSTISGISETVLIEGRSRIYDFSIAQRMAWAAKRTATRPEDEAYSLLGIFDAHMPMLYGEGGTNAFRRLQQEMIRNSVDESIFVWSGAMREGFLENEDESILASSPADFRNSGDIIPWPGASPASYQLTNVGLEIELPVVHLPEKFDPFSTRTSKPVQQAALLRCRSVSNLDSLIALPIYPETDSTAMTPRTRYWITPHPSSGRFLRLSRSVLSPEFRLTQLTIIDAAITRMSWNQLKSVTFRIRLQPILVAKYMYRPDVALHPDVAWSRSNPAYLHQDTFPTEYQCLLNLAKLNAYYRDNPVLQEEWEQQLAQGQICLAKVNICLGRVHLQICLSMAYPWGPGILETRDKACIFINDIPHDPGEFVDRFQPIENIVKAAGGGMRVALLSRKESIFGIEETAYEIRAEAS